MKRITRSAATGSLASPTAAQPAGPLNTELEAELTALRDQLDALREAYGDAHQNLGTLYLEYENDPRTARVWFEKSLEIGPYPRPIVTEEYLPRCAG